MSDGSEPREPRELSPEAADLEAQIKGTLNDLVGDDPHPERADAPPAATGNSEDLSPEATGAFLGMVMAQVREDDLALRAIDADHPRREWLYLAFGVILIALILLGVVAYMSAIRTSGSLVEGSAQDSSGTGETQSGAEGSVR